jgi:hypothetical protein
MAGSDENRGKSRRPSAEDYGWSSADRLLGGRTIERLGDDVCGLYMHKETRSPGFLIWPQN